MRVEYTYYQMVDNMLAFSHIWAVAGELYSLGGGGGELIVNF